MLTIETTVDVPARRIADMMVGALECNDMTNAWVAAARLRTPTEEALQHDFPKQVWYDVEELWSGEFVVDVWEISDESVYEGGFDPEADPQLDLAELAEQGLTKRTITQHDLKIGVELMAKDHPKHFADLIDENDDAITADVFLQCVVLRDVVYG